MTPFAWSQPHDVNEHVAGIAQELRALGHAVTVLAPSGAHRRPDRRPPRARARRGRRRDRDRRRRADLAPVEPRRPGRRAREPAPRARSRARFDVVHGFEPGLPSLSYLALRDAEALGVATLLLAGAARLPAATRAAREAARAARRAARDLARRRPRPRPSASPATTAIVSPGVDTELFAPGDEAEADRRRAALGLAARSRARRCARCASCPAGRPCCCGRSRSRRGPAIPRALRDRVRVRSGRDAAARAARPRRGGDLRARPRRARRGCGSRRWPPAPRSPIRRASLEQPELAAAAVARLAEDEALRERAGARRARAAEAQSFAAVAARARRRLRAASRGAAGARRARRRSARRPRLDPRRPAHAHALVARLLDRGRRAARPRRGGGPRRDRGHRPQRLRRRARGGRAARAAAT